MLLLHGGTARSLASVFAFLLGPAATSASRLACSMLRGPSSCFLRSSLRDKCRGRTGTARPSQSPTEGASESIVQPLILRVHEGAPALSTTTDDRKDGAYVQKG